MDKTSLRKNYLAKRNLLSPSETARFSSQITSRFTVHSCFQENSDMLLYASIGNEPDTREIIGIALKEGKNVYLPKPDIANGEPLVARFRSWDSTERGAYGIPFPQGELLKLQETDIALVVMPGIVFDVAGNRIGFGKGYYDRLLGGLRIGKVALAYDFQVSETPLPTEGHDVRAGILFTEKRTIICHT